MKKILVTGGAGMIGSNLVKRLLMVSDCDVFVADNLWRGRRENLFNETGQPIVNMSTNFFEIDLRDAAACRRVTEGMDEVFHLADIVAGINYVFANQREVFRDNVLIDTNMLNAAADANVKRFLYVGTACSYPKKMQFGVDAPPLLEEDILPADPESGYGWSKLVGELQTELYGKETSMETGVVRLHNVYGYPTDYSAQRSQVIPALVIKAIKCPGEPFVVWGSGSQGRSFIHVDDVVRALIAAMEKGLGCGAIQVGTGTCVSIRELAETIVKVSGKHISIEYDLTKPEGDKGRCGDCRKAERILGWTPCVPLELGLKGVYEWILSQYTRSKG